jgi:hypothetical protein
MESVDSFFTTEKTTEKTQPVKKNKKRKRPQEKDEKADNLDAKARFYCRSPDQWLIVKKYSKDRMECFVQEQEYTQQKQLYDTVFGFAHKCLAISMDVCTKGRDCVYQEIMADVTLRQSIEIEGVRFLQYLTNEYKILALCMIDSFNGKLKEIQTRPAIQEEKNVIHSETSQQLVVAEPSQEEEKKA